MLQEKILLQRMVKIMPMLRVVQTEAKMQPLIQPQIIVVWTEMNPCQL